MPHIPMKYAPRLIWSGTKNYFSGSPLVVSFETTLACNANCTHCDLGGTIKNEKKLKPEEFRKYVDTYRPVAVQLSGGEPLLRKDLREVVQALKINPFFPYTILVTNGWLLSVEKYKLLRDVGVNQFSISLDFPDERHDEFRKMNGLFARMDKNIPEIVKLSDGDVVLNTAITAANVRDIPGIVETARRWGVCLSFSIYTPLRTGDKSLVVSSPQDIEYLENIFSNCKKRKGIYASVVNSKYNLDGLMKFVKDGVMPNCTAGKRFLVVRPDGLLNPCSLHRVQFDTQKEMVREFSMKNRCGGCYVSIRSYVEISFIKLFWENVTLRVFNSRNKVQNRQAPA